MITVTISSDFQVTIPPAIRENLLLAPGEKMQVLQHSDGVEFVPVRSVREMRGFVRGMNTDLVREDDRL